ncbi:hypothetical protein [Devosia sp. 919]|uniref:hypothetical protein n=1 Tax=Devosia sp. 919 TaxID=2726065 RepID=UPI0020C0297F|nr:hypothetical protein [Devosia sp. 919]
MKHQADRMATTNFLRQAKIECESPSRRNPNTSVKTSLLPALEVFVNRLKMATHCGFGGNGVAIFESNNDALVLCKDVGTARFRERILPGNAPVGTPKRGRRQIVHGQQQDIVGTDSNGPMKGEVGVFETMRVIRMGDEFSFLPNILDLFARRPQGAEASHYRLELDPHFHHFCRTGFGGLFKKGLGMRGMNGGDEGALPLAAPDDALRFKPIKNLTQTIAAHIEVRTQIPFRKQAPTRAEFTRFNGFPQAL